MSTPPLRGRHGCPSPKSRDVGVPEVARAGAVSWRFQVDAVVEGMSTDIVSA